MQFLYCYAVKSFICIIFFVISMFISGRMHIVEIAQGILMNYYFLIIKVNKA